MNMYRQTNKPTVVGKANGIETIVTIPTRNQASTKTTGLVSNAAEKEIVIDKARASITELVEDNLRKHRQSKQG